MKCLFGCLAVTGSAFALAPAASGATIGATVVDASSGDYSLTSVSITRGSAGTFTYEPANLIGVNVTDVDAFSIPIQASRGNPLPSPGSRVGLLEDGRIDTGVINITTTNGTADRSVEITFAKPVVNSDGEDIVLFEVGGDDGIRFWINNDREGQGATLTTASYSGNLFTGVTYTQYRYSNAGDTDINSIAELEGTSGFAFDNDGTATIRAIGLDLSLLGVPMGGSITSFRFQSVANAGGRLDPVFIAGLPAVPEPTSALVVAVSGIVAATRRRRV